MPLNCNQIDLKMANDIKNVSDSLESHQNHNENAYNERTVNEIEKKTIIRRAFSMPRNPFRMSRRAKTTNATTKIIEHSKSMNNDDEYDKSNHSIEMMASNLDKHNTLPNKITTKLENYPDNNNKYRVFRRSTWKKFISRIAQQINTNNFGAKQSASLDRRVPPLGGYVWPSDQVPGVTGLKNHGNTCFMNAVLQCLSHTDILAEYFVLDQYKVDLKRRNKLNSRKFGTKGELTEQLAQVLKALWTCRNESDYSTSFKAVVDRYGTQFRSSTQHDAQEFLFWLLDKVHEDLNTASKRKYKSMKNYGRSDEIIAAETLANHIRCNNSFVQAVFQAQFRSSLTCPRCHRQSNTFDPFHCVSVQLPQLAQQNIYVTVLYATQHPKQVKLGLSVPFGSPVIALREQLQADTGIPLELIILTEISTTGFVRVICDSHPIATLSTDDKIYCIESIEQNKDDNGISKTKAGTTTTSSTTPTTITTTTAPKESTPNGNHSNNLTLIIMNAKRLSPKDNDVERFGTPFCINVNRDISFTEMQKLLLKEMQTILKPEVFAYATPINEMFRIRLQDPSADPDTYLESNVEHPLFTEMIDLALSVLPSDAGPPHIKLLLEWNEPDKFFCDMTDPFVEHESVSLLEEKTKDNSNLTLEQCLEHYTKAETLSAEDAWRCPHCQQYLPVVKTLGLWSLPDILVIHFKRFRQQHSKGPQSSKLTTTVEFPLTNFDMTPHLAKGSIDQPIDSTDDSWSPWKKLRKREQNSMLIKENKYDLYAVCYHQGDTLETGHYTAACKNPYDHQWYKFDDQKVNVVPADKVPEEIVNNEAYILFYQRRKPDSSECSGSSSGSDHWVSRISAPPVASTSKSVSVRASATTLNSDDKKENAVHEDDAKKTVIIPNEKIEVTVEVAPNDKEELKVTVEINIIPSDIPIKIEPTNEDEVIDVENVESSEESTPIAINDSATEIDSINEPSIDVPIDETNEIIDAAAVAQTTITAAVAITKTTTITAATTAMAEAIGDDIDIEVQLRNANDKQIESKLSTSFPTQRSLWPFDNHTTIHTFTPILNRGSLNFNDLFSNPRERNTDLRHSLSTSLSRNDKSAVNDAIAMLRGVSSCSKDTLIYLERQNHRSLIADDSNYLLNRSLWISPVTPHKLVSVSPKN